MTHVFICCRNKAKSKIKISFWINTQQRPLYLSQIHKIGQNVDKVILENTTTEADTIDRQCRYGNLDRITIIKRRRRNWLSVDVICRPSRSNIADYDATKAAPAPPTRAADKYWETFCDRPGAHNASQASWSVMASAISDEVVPGEGFQLT